MFSLYCNRSKSSNFVLSALDAPLDVQGAALDADADRMPRRAADKLFVAIIIVMVMIGRLVTVKACGPGAASSPQ
jgi:hypothetical protein